MYEMEERNVWDYKHPTQIHYILNDHNNEIDRKWILLLIFRIEKSVEEIMNNRMFAIYFQFCCCKSYFLVYCYDHKTIYIYIHFYENESTLMNVEHGEREKEWEHYWICVLSATMSKTHQILCHHV